MKPRLPIYAKVLLWFTLNLVLLGVALLLLFGWRFPLGLSSLLMDQAGERFQTLSQVLAGELDRTPSGEWDAALERLGAAYHLSFFVFRSDGPQLAGPTLSLPAEVVTKVQRCGPGMMMMRGRGMMMGGPGGMMRGPGMMRGMGDGAGAAGNVPPGGSWLAKPSILRTMNPTRYWLVAPLPLANPPSGQAAALVGVTGSLQASHLGVDLRPLGIAAVAAFFLSALLWLLPVRSFTHAITGISRATTRIAKGQLDARVPADRRDELGDLAVSINHMAAQLEGLLHGQKRFLADTAHELCSPIARLQLALAILEQRLGDAPQEDLANVRKEVQHIADLVNELLAFSKASLGHTSPKIQAFSCRAAAEQVLQQEMGPGLRVELRVPEDLHVLGDPELLQRALANLLRNAVRYAAKAGPITIAAESDNGAVRLTVADLGPGVPEAELPRIFAPFYRVDAARAPRSGGVGLGLAIVKTCVESCGGTVIARNREPSGLEVTITLPAAPDADDAPQECRRASS